MSRNLVDKEDNKLLRETIERRTDPMSRRVIGYIKAFEREVVDLPDMDKRKAGFSVIRDRIEMEKEQGRKEAQRKIEDAKRSYDIYKKSATEELLKQNQAKSLSTLMPDNELEGLINRAANAETWQERAEINQHEALAAAEELQRRGKGVPLTSRQALANIHYGQPWLNTETGDAGLRESWVHSAPKGKIRFSDDYSHGSNDPGYDLELFVSDGKEVQ